MFEDDYLGKPGKNESHNTDNFNAKCLEADHIALVMITRSLQKLVWNPKRNIFLFYEKYEKAKQMFGSRVRGSCLLKDKIFEGRNGTIMTFPYESRNI